MDWAEIQKEFVVFTSSSDSNKWGVFCNVIGFCDFQLWYRTIPFALQVNFITMNTNGEWEGYFKAVSLYSLSKLIRINCWGSLIHVDSWLPLKLWSTTHHHFVKHKQLTRFGHLLFISVYTLRKNINVTSFLNRFCYLPPIVLGLVSAISGWYRLI